MTFRFLLVFFIEFPCLNIDAREECNLLSIHKQLKGKEVIAESRRILSKG
jgi:hypothetical protein